MIILGGKNRLHRKNTSTAKATCNGQGRGTEVAGMHVFLTHSFDVCCMDRHMENFCVLKQMVLLLLNIFLFPGLTVMHKLVVDNNILSLFIFLIMNTL